MEIVDWRERTYFIVLRTCSVLSLASVALILYTCQFAMPRFNISSVNLRLNLAKLYPWRRGRLLVYRDPFTNTNSSVLMHLAKVDARV